MEKKNRVNLKYPYNSIRFLILSIIIFTTFILFISASIIVNASQTNSSTQNSVLPGTVDKTDPATGWKIATDIRSNINFTIKYPPGWDEASDYCVKPPTSKGLTLSSACLRLIIITDQLPPDDESSIGRDIVLTSETSITIQGYKAIRKIYSLPDDPENIPDTYQLWIYDKDHPFILVIGWIGADTDTKTAERFVQILDHMANTLQLHKK